MTSRYGRRRARRRKLYAFLTAGIVLVALIAVAAFAMRGVGADPVAAPSIPPTLAPVPTPSRAPSPTPTVTPEPTLSTVEPDMEVVETEDPDTLILTADQFLPIYKKADTDKKIIAITIDDLYQTANAREIVDLAIDRGAQLTLFPIGENALRRELGAVLRRAYDHGMEIENHTYEHVGLYRLDDEEMARQVFLQMLAVDYALGVDYRQHFFRPYGGDGLDDQRTHLYAKQLGMRGIAYWTVSGSDTPANKLVGTLAPGNVYLFHTTDEDTKKLKKFIPAAIEAGYELVTMNELFGLPDNTVKELKKPLSEYEIPPIVNYRLAPRDYGLGDFQWTVNRIQQRLIALGYLAAEADGVYGDETGEAVRRFQELNDLPVTGTADIETQDRLFAADAKRETRPLVVETAAP